MKCNNCGREIADDSVFCEFCGTKVQKPEVVQIEKDKPKQNKAKPIIISFVIIAILGVAIYIILEQQEEKRRLELEISRAQQQADEEAAARAIDDSLQLVRLQEERERLALEKAAAEEASKKAEEEALYAQQIARQALEAQKKSEREAKVEQDNSTMDVTYHDGNNMRKIGIVKGEILTVTDNNFSDFISMSYQLPVIIDFYGSWCSWCVKMSPIIENIAQKRYYGKIIIGKYYISRNFDETMLKRYNITGIPHFLFFQNGRIVHEADGYTDEDEMVRLINKYFAFN